MQVAVVKQGYALTSWYQVTPAGVARPTEPLHLPMAEGVPMTVVVHDAAGAPVPHAQVVPTARQASDGQEYAVYFQASGPIQFDADAAGRVALGCFERGDKATIYVRLPGHDWEQHVVDIPRGGDEIILVIPPLARAGNRQARAGGTSASEFAR